MAKGAERAKPFTPAEARVYRQSDDVVISLTGIRFATGRSNIDAANVSLMNKVRDALALFPDSSMVIEGHTDSNGSDSTNLILSQDRADAVRQYLVTTFGINPEKVSSICAVLAETDVINMVSRGIATPDILKGIHISMASRLVKLLKVTGITKGTVLLTGGLALDEGLLAALQEELVNEKIAGLAAVSHPDSIYAGAIGAALWGSFRFNKLKQLQERVAA